MKFSIIKDYNQVQSKFIPLPDGTRKEVFWQDMYMHKGGAFPVQFSVNVESPLLAYPVGDYTIDPSSFTTNKYGSLELSRYDVKFIPIKF